MPRPQFTLKTMLWLVVVAGAFLGGFMLGGKSEVMRRQHDTIRSFYLNADGTLAPPGVETDHMEIQVTPRYPWLQYLPEWDDRSDD